MAEEPDDSQGFDRFSFLIFVLALAFAIFLVIANFFYFD